MKDVGLVGVPFSGKSTLFTAMTRAGSQGGQANIAVVPVPDPRLQVLTDMESSKKTVAAQVRFVDVPGGVSSARASRSCERWTRSRWCCGASAGTLRLSTSSRPCGRMLLADLGVIDSALEKAEKKARGKPGPEVDALRRAKEALEAEKPLRDAGVTDEDAAHLRGIAPLTLKPEAIIANLEEGLEVPPALAEVGAVGVYASIEAETAEMDADEARALLEEFGVSEPGLETVIAASYQAIDLITFLTTGEDETRAWEVRRGAKAPEAAGVIHSDLERGFIRAEVVGYDELIAAGSLEAARAAGKLRQEGKDYEVVEGDILNIRFNV